MPSTYFVAKADSVQEVKARRLCGSEGDLLSKGVRSDLQRVAAHRTEGWAPRGGLRPYALNHSARAFPLVAPPERGSDRDRARATACTLSRSPGAGPAMTPRDNSLTGSHRLPPRMRDVAHYPWDHQGGRVGTPLDAFPQPGKASIRGAMLGVGGWGWVTGIRGRHSPREGQAPPSFALGPGPSGGGCRVWSWGRVAAATARPYQP